MSVFFTDTDCEMDYTTAEELKINVQTIAMPTATKDFVNYIYSSLKKEGN